MVVKENYWDFSQWNCCGFCKAKKKILWPTVIIIHVIENSCMHQETGLLLNHMLRFVKKRKIEI